MPISRYSVRRFHSIVVILFTILTGTASAIGGLDVDGNGKSQILLRNSNGQSMLGRWTNNALVFTPTADPGPAFRLLGAADFNGNGKSDLAFQDMTQGESGDVRIWTDGTSTNNVLLRSVKRTWDVQVVGDLDGDGYADLVWRYVAPDSPDTGVSYIWFTNGTSVTQVRKRGGAPLNWRLLGAADLNGDGAADMIYISPDGSIRALMATTGRTCANLAAGSLPLGDYEVVKLGDFTGNRLGEILIRNRSSGQVLMMQLDATGATLPPPTANPDDRNASCTATPLTAAVTTYIFANANPTWRYYAAGDLDGDGRTDIIWLRPDGGLTVWLMKAIGKVPSAPTVIDNAGTAPVGHEVIQVLPSETLNGTGSQSIRFSGIYPEQATLPFITKGGEQFTANGAFVGWAKLMVAPTTPASTVRAAATQLGARLISQSPSLGLYVFDAGLGRESAFLSAMYSFSWVVEGSAVIPSARGANYTLDFDSAATGNNCRDNHGTIVTNIANRRNGAFTLETPTGNAQNPVDVADQVLAKLKSVATGERQVINISLNIDPFGLPPFTQLGGPSRNTDGLCVAAGCAVVGLCTSTCRQSVTRHWTFQQYVLLWDFFSAMEQVSISSPAKADQSLITIIAGNSGWELDGGLNALRNEFPNALKRIVIVGGTDHNGAKSTDFNHLADDSSGSMVYACAKGVVNTAFPVSCGGTSFAGPEVASVLDAVWRRYPSLTSEQIYASLKEALNARQPPTAVIPQDDSCWTSSNFIDEVLVIAANKLPPPPLCIGYLYFDWMACQPNNIQTRNILSRNPANCMGGALPETTRSCVYVPSGCQYSLSNTGTSIPNSGGIGRISVSTTPGCSWKAESSDPFWLSILTGAIGGGSDVVSWSASANVAPVTRMASITVSGLLSGMNFVQVTNFIQDAACSFTLSAASAIPAAGGAGSISLTASAPSCAWTAVSDSLWLTVGTGSSMGNGVINFIASANPSSSSRSGSIAVGGQSVQVTQAGVTTPPSSCTVTGIRFTSNPTLFGFINGAITPPLDNISISCSWQGNLGSSSIRQITTNPNGSFSCASSDVASWADSSFTVTAAVTACTNVSVSITR